MTIPEFIEKFKKYGNRFYALPTGIIRTARDRFHPIYNDDPCRLCPICEVALAETGEFHFSHDFFDAARTLGLEREDARAIARAADDAPELKELRHQLLEAMAK
jgi:hypothetical protein